MRDALNVLPVDSDGCPERTVSEQHYGSELVGFPLFHLIKVESFT